MKYEPIPIALLELGQPIPVDVWAPDGRLLLRKGQALRSEEHKEMLSAHQAAMTETDAKAWHRSLDRLVQQLLREGVDAEAIARVRMPRDITENDYIVGREVRGGWLDLQEILRSLLYQGAAAISPLPRLEGLEIKARELLQQDPDEGLFTLFQALADTSLGYCATHALLSGVVCELTASKLGLPEAARKTLFRAALTMNIGMARDQDSLARQRSPLYDTQRRLIREHPQTSVAILQTLGVIDGDQLDLVRWHHEPDLTQGRASNQDSRRILSTVDSFVAKMAARQTRQALSPLVASKSLLLSADPHTVKIGSAMATALGFYPPGTYVQLVNGETAVAIARGSRANMPQVVSLVTAAGMPLSKYVYRDTSDAQFAIHAPLNPEKVKIKVSLEKVRRVRSALSGADSV